MTDERYDRIALYYGAEHQLRKLAEECGELTAAALRFINDPPNQKEHFVEEMADVAVVWRQLVAFFGISEKVEGMAEYKLERQLKRIREEEDEVSSRS